METREIIDNAWRRIASINDPRMRTRGFLGLLARLHDDDVALALNEIYLDALRKKSPAAAMLETFADSDEFIRFFTPARLSLIYQRAEELSLVFACEILSPSQRSQTPKRQPMGHRDLNNLSLGEKKALARRCDPTILEKLLLEPEPAVIHNLLNNPHLVERDVLKICSRRPNRGDVLMEVWRSEKWRRSLPVRLALAANPYAPARTVLVVLPSLTLPELRRLGRMRLFDRVFLDLLLVEMHPGGPEPLPEETEAGIGDDDLERLFAVPPEDEN